MMRNISWEAVDFGF